MSRRPTENIQIYLWGEASPHIVVKDRRVWFGLASDDPLHPALRLHAWRCATFGRSLSDLRSMCRALGVPNYTRLDREELTANVVAHVPDVFDDPRHAILDADIPPELDPNGVVSFHRTNDPDTLR